jgi:hypothetical protein
MVYFCIYDSTYLWPGQTRHIQLTVVNWLFTFLDSWSATDASCNPTTGVVDLPCFHSHIWSMKFSCIPKKILAKLCFCLWKLEPLANVCEEKHSES